MWIFVSGWATLCVCSQLELYTFCFARLCFCCWATLELCVSSKIVGMDEKKLKKKQREKQTVVPPCTLLSCECSSALPDEFVACAARYLATKVHCWYSSIPVLQRMTPKRALKSGLRQLERSLWNLSYFFSAKPDGTLRNIVQMSDCLCNIE